MNTTVIDQVPRHAPGLNAACQCIWLDRDRLRRQLDQNLGGEGRILESRPGLISGSAVFLDRHDADSMDRTARLVQRALSSPAYRSHVDASAPPIARQPLDDDACMLGIDFHLGGPDPQLIEINTNPGGLLVNLELARAVTAPCACMTEHLPGLAAGSVPLVELPSLVTRTFRDAWTRVRGNAPLRAVAIVDDDPVTQYLHPELLLYGRLFERAGWPTRILDAGNLAYEGGSLAAAGRTIDLVYNRLTDFYLDEPRHAALRRACETDAAVITPNPTAHAHRADKRLLAWLRDEILLGAAGLDRDDRAHLLRSIPSTEIVDHAAADDLWRRRKQLFFKPVDGYGGKAAYRGDRLTRATYGHILAHRYVAQAVAPTSTRRIVIDGQESDLRVDIRNYGTRGTTWLRAARLYRGQTTNFRTPGGGFAPVLTLPA